jgi:predicted Zn-dependent protease
LHDEYVTHSETPVDSLSQLAIDGIIGYFRTHPLPSERPAQAREVIAQNHLPLGKPLKPFHAEYEATSEKR